MMENAKSKTSGAGAPAKRPEWSLQRKILLCTGIAIVALVLLTVLGLWLTFSPYRDFSAPDIGQPHYLFLRDVASQLRNNRREPEATIRLSPREVKLLLDIVRHSSQYVHRRDDVPPPEYFMLDYRGGGLAFAVPISVGPKWCFGGKVYISGVLYFEKEGDAITADLRKLGFGRFDLPVPGGIDAYVPDWKKKLKNAFTSEYMHAIKRVYRESDGTVVLVYRPAELRKPLKKHLTKVRDRCSGDLRPWITQVIHAL